MSLSAKELSGAAFRRRLTLACIVILLVTLVALPMSRLLGAGGWTFWEIVFFALFVLLVAQVAFAAVVASVGWWLLRRGVGAARISSAEASAHTGPLPATAIVMPIYNEDTNRVFQGLRAMYHSLQETGRGENFDFFILSDTSDTNHWIAEERAWFDLCQQYDAFGRIFYRRRRVRAHHKSGNIADFCRRWGANYRYMLVLDADSVMTGDSFVRLASLMELHPRAGILQTMTRPILGSSLFQRIDQFAAWAYRPLFATGTSFWQLGDSTFFGHNAIIRLKPFMEQCAMPQLPEIGPLGRQILSHDTIEAALMRRSGHEVWQVTDLEGTYEEGPPNLLESLKRDRRWCHGNLQHFWFLFERGLKTVSRFNILTGILAYANSPFWLASLMLGFLIAWEKPGHREAAVVGSGFIYAEVMFLLFLPKFLGAAWLMYSPEKTKVSGQGSKIVWSVAAETLHSMLLAPILMLFYTRFVIASLCGFKVSWGTQTRSDEKGPAWGAWIQTHGSNTLFVLALTALVIHGAPWLLPWMAPVLIGPILAIPFSRLTASQALGRKAAAAGWFRIPEEQAPPEELKNLERPFLPPAMSFFQAKEYKSDYGLLQAILDPYINAIHVSMLRQRKEASQRTQGYLTLLSDRLLLDGPYTLSPGEKRTLLWDADAMLAMHQKLWSSPSSHLHEWWQGAFRNYVESSALSIRRTAAL